MKKYKFNLYPDCADDVDKAEMTEQEFREWHAKYPHSGEQGMMSGVYHHMGWRYDLRDELELYPVVSQAQSKNVTYDYDKIVRYDEYIVTDKTSNSSFRLAGYELPNGRFVLCEANRATMYVDFQTYRKKLGDVLENYRLNENCEAKFVSGTTKLTAEK